MIDLEKIRERWSRATPGPWIHQFKDSGNMRAAVYRARPNLRNPERAVLERVCYCNTEAFDDGARADAEAIAAAPTDIADLIGEVEQLREALRQIADSISHEDLEGAQSACEAFADLIES